jgi:phage baseplate assembly protein W
MANPINIKFPLRKSANGSFETNATTIQAVADDLKMLIITNHGERVAQYTYGANLRSVLFEPNDPSIKQKVSDLIFAAVQEWMPFVSINQLDVILPSEDLSLNVNSIKVKIYFSVLQEKGFLEVPIK